MTAGNPWKPTPPIHSRYADGTAVFKGQQPPRISGPDFSAAGCPHSVIRWDWANGGAPMQSALVQVVSIHDMKGSVLGFDLKEILNALKGHLRDWKWCIYELDCVGTNRAISRGRAAAPEKNGLWLSSEELVSLAADIQQTVDATLLAFPADIDPQTIRKEELDVAHFPSSRAELVVLAVDSSFFEVYLKSSEIEKLLEKHFRDVRMEDPGLYFVKS
jgi:hypothetical protein